MSDKEKYPECEKMLAVSKESQSIGSFLDWLHNEKEIHLCTYEENDIIVDDEGFEELAEGFYGVNKSINTLLAEYFEVDLVKAEEEKRAILKDFKKQNKL